MVKFQYYPAEITKCKPINYISLEDFIKTIKEPKPHIKELFKGIKEAEIKGDNALKQQLKTKLFKFTPCVHIKDWRCFKGITGFTGLLVLDFDHLPIDYAVKFKEQLFNDCKFVCACWLSPSRHGIKALIKIPISKDVEEFKSYFRAIKNRLGNCLGFDQSAQNPVLDLFLSYDENVLYRSDAETFKEQFFEPKIEKPIKINTSYQIDENPSVIASIIIKNINQITNEGHPILRSTAYSLGGYVGAGYITKDDALYLINRCIDESSYLSQKDKVYKKTAKTMIENGISEPLYLDEL